MLLSDERSSSSACSSSSPSASSPLLLSVVNRLDGFVFLFVAIAILVVVRITFHTGPATTGVHRKRSSCGRRGALGATVNVVPRNTHEALMWSKAFGTSGFVAVFTGFCVCFNILLFAESACSREELLEIANRFLVLGSVSAEFLLALLVTVFH